MEYTINNYRSRRFGDKYFLTTDSGSNIVLNENEFSRLKQNDIDEALYDKLAEKEIILTPENIGEYEQDLAKRNSFLFYGTSLHIIVVTLRCDMKCIYCHASSRDKDEQGFDMDKETAKRTVDFIFRSPNPCITIEFQGGEPLLNWDVVKFIIEYAEEKNKSAGKDLRITIVSNFTAMDEEKMEYLIGHDVFVCTSLDGPKEIHDFNRRCPHGSNYDAVIKWIKRFQAEYERRDIKTHKINALVTLTNKSLGCPKEIIDEYVKHGMDEIHLRFLNHLGVAQRTWPSINYSVDEYLKFWRTAIEYINQLQKSGTKINERIVNIMVDKIVSKYDTNYAELKSPCGAVTGQLVYDYNGDIYTCDEARMIGDDLFLLGNVRENAYKDVVTCDKACAVVNASINDQYICDSCAYKPYCGVCPVCNYVDQGSIIGKITQTYRCKIFRAQFDWVVRENFINGENQD